MRRYQTSGISDDSRFRLYRNPLRQVFSASTWQAVWYLIGYVCVTGWLLFAVSFTVATTAAVLSITLAGIPLAIAAADVVSRCAAIERRRLRQAFIGPVTTHYEYRHVAGRWAQAKASWRDRAVWQDLGYLTGLWVPLFVLDTVVLSVWAWFLSWISMPLWYWAPWLQYQGRRVHGYQLGFYFPHGPDGPGTVGVFVNTLPKALLVAVAGLVGFLLLSYLLVLTARMHARVARAVLGPPADPLAEAKKVLSTAGPLGPLGPAGTR